ncbi:MAG: pseudouridine synthase [candidate division FCPU426 bacterium]
MPDRTPLCRALSKLGFCSRAQAETLIRSRGVRVNGCVQIDPLAWVDLKTDRFEAKTRGAWQRLESAPARVYLLLNKPAGYVTTRSDERGRKTVYDLLPDPWREAWVFPVGRLDLESEGLLILTNDGAWGQQVADPLEHVTKTYIATLDRKPRDEELARMREGLLVGNEKWRPARIIALGPRCFEVTLTEGRNRQIRRMFWAARCRVKRLVRVAIGTITDAALGPGEVRELQKEEVQQLRNNL